MWEKLSELGQPMNMSWPILGDFNCVKSPTEKQLGAIPTWYELKDFADCCLSLGLNDAPIADATLLGTPTVRAIPCGASLIRCFSTMSGLRLACFVMRISAHRDAFSTTHRDFMATVENDWNLNVDGTTQFSLCRKLKALKGHLKAFNNLHFSHISVKAKDADLALQDAQIQLESDPENAVIRDSVGELRKKAVFLAEAERHFYYQKAKLHFLKMGDRNTKFFHDMVKRNAPKSSILAITKTDGSTITSAMEIDQEFVSYFTSLLGTEERRLLRQLNHSIIALVPKSDHCPTVADYWHSCNVIYKAITKIIADQLTPALEHLTDRCQAAFVGGQSITGNIFLAQEMVRQYTRKRISPRCIINVDLRKVFDSVSWTFLSQVLHGYGFPPIFIAWIMECVSTSSFSVALNGSLHGFFVGKKWLRQGDPMSPALFLLCMEYFSRQTKRKTTDSDFNFHPKCEKLKITHLLFADDLMMFSRGDLPSVHILMECLQEFRDVSGLTVNTSKSSIFTAGIENNMLREILARIEFARGEMPVRYLGIPLAAQRLSVRDYSPLVDQIANSIFRWAAKSLSFAGRLELIRSVIQGVECFWLQIFPLPVVVVEKIHRLCRNFLWNSKRAPVAWEDICHPKNEGGLGIRHTQTWNVALLARVLWNIHRKADTLWVQWVDAIYLKGGSVWDWQPRKGDSPLLQRLAEIRSRIITAFGSSEAAIQHMAGWSSSKGLDTSKAYEYFRPK
ncbi:UNVERIFIED_CONTAM: hypothetical protein Scaly_1008500 [Sesamum calycinum]|uniref:Reverse transcriptase domain-containing protein n=1 Tax=Sesamum calycinum TaxID=2727403 RepID=A0AAW2QIZ5_9LAMI